MSKIEIIPAIDLIGGKCVRLSQGDYDRKTTYNASPREMVERFVDAGLKRIHAVDLDGAKASHPCNLNSLEQMASVKDAQIEWGGGIKSDEDLSSSFNAGASFAVIGSVAARNPELFSEWLNNYSPDRMILGADVRNGKIAVTGWLSEEKLTLHEIINRFSKDGLSQAIVTDITKDGMLQGPSFDLYCQLQERFPEVCFTVSGGISSMEDITRLAEKCLPRVIVGKAIYEGLITLKEIEKFIIQ